MGVVTKRWTSEIDVLYQPQIRLSDGGLFGAEALARKRTGSKLVGADQFIPQLEARNQIAALDLLVLERVIAQQRIWLRRGIRTKISVNISRNSFYGPTFVGDYLSVIGRCGLPLDCLGFELTESALGASPAGMRMLLSELAGRGYAVALDDFGTGYSSLGMLDALPVQYAKLDKAFLNPEELNGRRIILLHDIVQLLQNLGIQALCEGVETGEQAVLVKSLGCDLAQGFFFSKPIPADAFERTFLFAKNRRAALTRSGPP